MIAIIVGTTAELIKIAPVYRELIDRERTVEIWYTGQHVGELAGVLADLELPDPALWLVPQETATNLARTDQVVGWAFRFFRTVLTKRNGLRARLRSDGRTPIVIVHGDTFTTLFGSLAGRFLGARVAHVEAGMRSGSLLHPFPEEINRKLTAKLAYVHFAPSEVEAENLAGRRHVVVTGGNTAIDAVNLALAKGPKSSQSGLPQEFAVATLHRFELVRDRELYTASIAALKVASVKIPIIYFAGESEKARLTEYGLLDQFDDCFVLRDKLPYVEFLPILARAQFVVTDSGGLQEESEHLGIPCAVHRLKTERLKGVGRTFVLTELDIARLTDFFSSYEDFRVEDTSAIMSPSVVVVDTIERLG